MTERVTFTSDGEVTRFVVPRGDLSVRLRSHLVSLDTKWRNLAADLWVLKGSYAAISIHCGEDSTAFLKAIRHVGGEAVVSDVAIKHFLAN